MKRKQKPTIKGIVLEYWKSTGGVCHFSEIQDVYCQASKLLGHNCSHYFSGMNVTRLLKDFGTKVGDPGDRTPWILNNWWETAVDCTWTKWPRNGRPL
jgi:hypothetical protein